MQDSVSCMYNSHSGGPWETTEGRAPLTLLRFLSVFKGGCTVFLIYETLLK